MHCHWCGLRQGLCVVKTHLSPIPFQPYCHVQKAQANRHFSAFLASKIMWFCIAQIKINNVNQHHQKSGKSRYFAPHKSLTIMWFYINRLLFFRAILHHPLRHFYVKTHWVEFTFLCYISISSKIHFMWKRIGWIFQNKVILQLSEITLLCDLAICGF